MADQVAKIDAAHRALGEAQDAHGRRAPEAIAAGLTLNAVVDASSPEELSAWARLANERQRDYEAQDKAKR